MHGEVYKPPRLNDEQRAEKARLLSRFRYFAKRWQGEWYYEQPHDEMCDELEACLPKIGTGKTQHKQIYLAPRYTYKTSLLIAFMAWCILYWREQGVDISIDYVRAASALAEDVLYELKHDLSSHEMIVEYWGDLQLASNVWAQKRINLGTTRDATVSTAGLDYGGAGKHPDLVICDDIVNEKNFDSIKAKRNARTKVQAYYPILPPWGSMIVCGTRFAHNDVYGWLLDLNEKDAMKNAELLAIGDYKAAQKVRPQWIEYIRSVRDKNGNLFFPAKLDEEFLAQQKRSIEARFYASWYENRPDVEGMVRFRMEYLNYFSAMYSRYPIPIIEIINERSTQAVAEIPVRLTMTLDPTVTARQGTSDWTGMSLVACDADDDWWVLFARRYLEVPSEIGEIAVKHIRQYRPEVLRIESAQADVDMVKRIQRAISEENLPTRIESYHPVRDEVQAGGRRKKQARIEALEPRFRNGKIHLHRNTCEALYDQYKGWPDIEHDDVFDALAMQYGLAKPCMYSSIRDFESEYRAADDPEEKGGIFAAYRTPEEANRVIGRTGLGSQRL